MQQVNDHPLSAAVAAEQEQYEYEIEGAPWWMPINQDIEYQPGAAQGDARPVSDVEDRISVINPYDEDVTYMDSVKVVVNDNPWLQHIADDKFKDGQDEKGGGGGGEDEISPQTIENKRKYLLSIDFQVNCRKFILFTSLLFFIVCTTFASSVYTGFYEWKGIGFNAAVCVLLVYGLFVGFFCSDMNKYSTRTLLTLLNVYWFLCWITIIGLFVTGIVYLVLFPNKFRNHCKKHDYCNATLEAIIFAECSLACTLLLYIFMMFFYLQRIAVLRLIICNLREYTLIFEQSLFMRVCHRHTYRYLRGWKSFRRIITRHTGLRISDILYCSCWFRKCRRNSSAQWKPLPSTQNSIKIAVDEDLKRYSSMENAEKDDEKKHDLDLEEAERELEEEQKKRKKRKKYKDSYGGGGYTYNSYNGYVYQPQFQRSECCCCCDNISYRNSGHNDTDCWLCYFCCRDCCVFCDWSDICNGCIECVGDMFKAIGGCFNPHNCNCVCCIVYHTDNVGECGECCKSCGHIIGGCCSGCDNCDCDCGGGGGGGGGDCGEGVAAVCMGILIAIVCIVLFLLPIIVFGLIAAPFWLLAQWICWKLNNKVPWIFVVFIFIIFLIPPCIIWAYLWTAICLGNMNGTFMTVMCQIWSFFYTVYSSFS